MHRGNPEQQAVQAQKSGHETRMRAKAKTDKGHRKISHRGHSKSYGKRMG